MQRSGRSDPIPDPGPIAERAARACDHCTRYKRRCDKALPSCGVCTRSGRRCVYPIQHAGNHFLRLRVQELEALLASKETSSLSSSATLSATTQLSDDPVSYLGPTTLRYQKIFLDSELFPHLKAPPLPDHGSFVSQAVLHLVGGWTERQTIVTQYFDAVHQWMPIVGKIAWQRLLASHKDDNATWRPDLLLLLLCMKLILHVPRDTLDATTCQLYAAAKEFAFKVEMMGYHSLPRLQACLLITVYEMGHGVFPSAYMSLGHCASLAIALGLHDNKAPQMLDRPRNRIDWEERLRTWWMVRILDRYITAGSYDRPLNTEEPDASAYLPADDEAWDRGTITTPDSMLLSSPDDMSASPFARVAQAAHLLGQVIRHCNARTVDLATVKANMDILSRITNSLLELLSKDDETVVRFRNAIPLCFSALLKLYDNHSCDSFTHNRESLSVKELALLREVTQDSVRKIGETCNRIATFQKSLDVYLKESRRPEQCLEFAPWIPFCFYRCSATMAWLGSTTQPQDRAVLDANKVLFDGVLGSIGKRWMVGGSYLEALSAVDDGLDVGMY